MARQGSLRQGTDRIRCVLPAAGTRCAKTLWIFGWLLATAVSSAGHVEGSPIDVRVTVEFKSPSPLPWNLRLSLQDDAGNGESSLGEIRNFSTAETTSGIFDLDRSGQMLTIHSRHAITGGKFELRIRGSREAKLWIEPQGKPDNLASMPPRREIPLVDLLGSPAIGSHESTASSEGTASWTIERVETDGLRLEATQPVPVYRPGAPLGLTVRANGMIDHAAESLVLQHEWYRVSDGEIIETHRLPIQIDAYGNSPSIPLHEIAPTSAGVHELRLRVAPDDDKLWSRLRRRSPPLVSITHSIAVLHSDSETDIESVPWSEAGVIRPSESSWTVGQWLPNPSSRLLPGASIPTIPNLESDTHAGESVSLIPPLGHFQATLPVQTPGYPHKVTIRFPSASTTALQVQVGGHQEDASTSFVLEMDSTADQQSPWRTHTFVHYPVEGDQIWLTNLDSNNVAAFDAVTVQAGPLQLVPKLAPKTPPSTSTRAAALRLDEIDWTNRFTADLSKRTNLSDCASSTIALHQLWVAANRIQDQARAMGCNGIVIPANSGLQAGYESSHYQAQDDVLASRRHHLETLLQLLEASQLQVYVGLQSNMLLTELERAIGQQEGQLVELTRSEPSEATRKSNAALPPGIAASRTQYNPLHPLVQRALADLVKELSDLCDHYQGFAGVIVDCDGNSHLRPLRTASADAGSILLFGRANNLSGNVAQLRNWIQQQGNEPFQTWAKQQLQMGYEQVGKATGVGTVRLLMPGTNAIEVAEVGRGETPKSNAQAPGQGVSPPSAGFVSSFRYGPPGVLTKKSLMQKQLSSLTTPLPAILFGEEWTAGAPALVRDQMLGDMCRMIDRAEPGLLIIDNSLVANRLEEGFSGSVRSFCGLPNQTLRESMPIDSASHTVRLRSGTVDGHLYVSMINVVPWHCDVDLEMTAPTQWEILGRTEEDRSSPLTQSSGGIRTRVTIPSGQMVVLRSKEPSSNSIRSWTTRVSGGPEAIESIKQKVTLIVERIGSLSDFKPYASLANGGFEQSGGMGLVGWLHAQHPPGCVQVDDQEFVEGSHSILLTTIAPAASRTWLVSETIEPPQSGRLAVSLASRAEAKPDESPHLLRISIEATRQGEPVRFSRDLEVARNGQWTPREVILEADGIDTSAIESLRLTIDSLSGGKVWIDDVQLHDRFPTVKERSELQSQAFLAVQGLQRGNLLPVGKLLQDPWARHLLSLGPNEQAKRLIESVPVPSEAPGVAERILNWLPRPLRF